MEPGYAKWQPQYGNLEVLKPGGLVRASTYRVSATL
jgi:hypothetical protein